MIIEVKVQQLVLYNTTFSSESETDTKITSVCYRAGVRIKTGSFCLQVKKHVACLLFAVCGFLKGDRIISVYSNVAAC